MQGLSILTFLLFFSWPYILSHELEVFINRYVPFPSPWIVKLAYSSWIERNVSVIFHLLIPNKTFNFHYLISTDFGICLYQITVFLAYVKV